MIYEYMYTYIVRYFNFNFNFSFGLDSLRQRHMYARHNKKILTCEYCGKTYSDKSHFNTHVQTHLDISERVFQPRPCEHCGDWLMTKSGLYYHEQVGTPIRPKFSSNLISFFHSFISMLNQIDPQNRCAKM